MVYKVLQSVVARSTRHGLTAHLQHKRNAKICLVVRQCEYEIIPPAKPVHVKN